LDASLDKSQDRSRDVQMDNSIEYQKNGNVTVHNSRKDSVEKEINEPNLDTSTLQKPAVLMDFGGLVKS
jgi:hypothetical protein